MSDQSSDPDRIERDLSETRSRLGSHLSELQDRFSPGQVLDDLMGYFRGSEGADIGRNLLESVRANPLPAAITGIGLAWLMASKTQVQPGSTVGGMTAGRGILPAPSRGTVTSNRPDWNNHEDLDLRLRSAEQEVIRRSDEPEDAHRIRLDEARGRVLGVVHQAQDTGESFAQRVQDALAQARQTALERAHDIRDQVTGAANSFGTVAQGAAQSISGVAQRTGSALAQGGRTGGNLVASMTESPVLLGALGLAAGALLGALLPQSDQEEAALGKIAGQARDTARDLAQEAVDRGSHVAQSVMAKGRDGVQQHGLAGGKSPGEMVDAALSGNLVGDAKQVAAEVLQAGDEAVRKEMPGQAAQQPRQTGSQPG